MKIKIIILLFSFLLLNSCTRFTIKYQRDLNHQTVEAVYRGIAINQPVIEEIKNNIRATEMVIDRKCLFPADRHKAEKYLANLINLQNLLEYQNGITPHNGLKNSQTAGEFTRFVSDLYNSQDNNISDLSDKLFKLRLLELKAEFEYLQKRLK